MFSNRPFGYWGRRAGGRARLPAPSPRSSHCAQRSVNPPLRVFHGTPVDPLRVSGKTRSTRVFPGAPTSHILTEPRTAVSSAPPPPLLRDCGMTRLSSACAWWRASVDVEKPPFPSRVFPEVQSSAPGKSRTPFKARGRVSPTCIYHHRCLGCVLKPIISTFCTKKKTG